MTINEMLNLPEVNDMYESPLTLITEQISDSMNMQLEDETLKVIQNIGIDVGKEELVKALNYDRNQYEKGKIDGINQTKNQIIELLKMRCEEYLEDCQTSNSYRVGENYRTLLLLEDIIKGIKEI